MKKDHKKNHTIALIGTVLVTIVIILLWIRVLLPMQQERNRERGSSTAELIQSVTPEILQKQQLPQPEDSSITPPLLDESSYQQ